MIFSTDSSWTRIHGVGNPRVPGPSLFQASKDRWHDITVAFNQTRADLMRGLLRCELAA